MPSAVEPELIGAGAGGAPRSDPDTSYLCVVDEAGNAFSATPSDGVTSTPIVPELGFTVSPRGAQSWLDPAHPAAVQPRKRPRLTPNPALATRDGELFLAFGTPGNDAQPQTMVQVFLNIVEFGMNPQQAVEAPRLCSLNFPRSRPSPHLHAGPASSWSQATIQRSGPTWRAGATTSTPGSTIPTPAAAAARSWSTARMGTWSAAPTRAATPTRSAGRRGRRNEAVGGRCGPAAPTGYLLPTPAFSEPTCVPMAARMANGVGTLS